MKYCLDRDIEIEIVHPLGEDLLTRPLVDDGKLYDYVCANRQYKYLYRDTGLAVTP